MKHYHQLLSYGDLIELETRCNTDKLLKEIKDFEWKQYNPRKEINRYGLSITSSDGTRNGICLLYTSPSPRDSDSSRMPSSA